MTATAVSIQNLNSFLPQMTILGPCVSTGNFCFRRRHAQFQSRIQRFSVSDDNMGPCASSGNFCFRWTTSQFQSRIQRFLPRMTIWDPAPAREISASDDGHCSFNPESEQFSASDDNIGTLRQHGKFLLQTTTRAVPIQNPEIFCLR